MDLAAVRERIPSIAEAQTQATTLRRVACWLCGTESQREALEYATRIASDAGARFLALMADGPARSKAEPLPLGGACWARWAAERRRAEARSASATALRELRGITRDRPVQVELRRAGAGPEAFAPVLAGCDLAVVPAGAWPGCATRGIAGDAAATIARLSDVPVLRVRRRPTFVRRVVLVVSGTAGCAQLARRFLRSGVWRDASLHLLPVAAYRRDTEGVVGEQSELIRAHGREVEVMDPIDLDFDADDLRRRARRFDGAAIACLPERVGWFGMARDCAFEVVSEAVPATLLP